MNETIRQLFERTSTRAFSNEPVSSEDERLILEAACQAPTAGNQQLYTIIVARDQAVKDALARSCDNQPMISRAPLVLAFCADMRRWARAFEEGGCDRGGRRGRRHCEPRDVPQRLRLRVRPRARRAAESCR